MLSERSYREQARDIPIVEKCDVLVCGGGPAGVAAALAAARAGARAHLIELHGCLGGVWTAGNLSWILDPADKPGVMREIILELERRSSGTWRPKKKFAADPEVVKLLLEELCLEAGVTVRLHTRVVAAARDARNRLAVAVTESKSGRQAWAARVFVDTTGDGDLAAQAGCGFDVGHPETGECQPMSLIAVLTGLRYDEVGRYTTHENGKPLLLDEMARVGVSPSYSAPTLICVREGTPDSVERSGLFILMANHEYGVSAMDGKRGLYRLGPKVLYLARTMRSEAALAAAAEPELRALAEATGEAVALAVVRGGRIWSVLGFTGSRDVVAQPRLAQGEPYFHTTGRGKLHLAHLPRDEARALIAATGLPKVGPHTITDEAALWREVDEAKRRGYAVNRAQRSPHLAGVAIPVFDADGSLLATLGITVPVFTLDEAREAELAQLGTAAARRIEERLHGIRLRLRSEAANGTSG